jgi:hypothetical protein
MQKTLPTTPETDTGDNRAASRTIHLCQFICLAKNGETFVAWTETKEQAAKECQEHPRSTVGKPWKILATGNAMDVPAN